MCDCCPANRCPGCCPDPRKKLALTKPLMLSNGTPARLLTSDLKGDTPIVVAARSGPIENVYLFDTEGQNRRSGLRLVNVPPKTVTIKRWAEVVSAGAGESFDGYKVVSLLDFPVAQRTRSVIVPVKITFTPEE